jgi:hypothetical protein
LKHLVDGIQRIYHGGWDPTDISWWVGSNGYMMVDGIQVYKVEAVSQSKSRDVAYGSRTLYALATLGAHSPCTVQSEYSAE